jgi:homoserine kinase
LGSGLGSSAASAVAGAFAVNELLGGPYTKNELVRFAMAGEKVASGAEHADNVSPSLLGGIVLIRSYHPLEVISLPVPSKLIVIVVHPEVEVLTKSARAILPKQIPLTDAIAQWSNTAAFTKGLFTNDYALIGRSVTDRIAEPRRAKLIPNFENVKHAAILNGALACSISGSGPSVFALCDGKKRAKKIANAMKKEFSAKKIKSISYISHINQRGVIVI